MGAEQEDRVLNKISFNKKEYKHLKLDLENQGWALVEGIWPGTPKGSFIICEFPLLFIYLQFQATDGPLFISQGLLDLAERRPMSRRCSRSSRDSLTAWHPNPPNNITKVPSTPWTPAHTA